MLKIPVKFSLIIALFSVCFFTACKDTADTDAQEVDEFVDQALLSVADQASVGADGCYELVFPVSIEFTDGTIVEVNSVEEMKNAFRTWKANHPDVGRRNHPSLVLPIDFITEDGELITVETKMELRRLRAACGHGPHDRRGKRGDRECACFAVQFPVTILFPDGSTAEIADRSEFKPTIRAWKEANPDVDGRPELVFPITVVLQDGTSVEVDSLEALKALKKECRDGE